MSEENHAALTAPSATPELLAKISDLEKWMLEQPQCELTTEHLFHAGMYARTIRVDGNRWLTGVLIKRETILILSGFVRMATENGWVEFRGYHVLAGGVDRKPLFHVIEETAFTMLFPTNAKTVEEAEAEFTDEAARLLSRLPTNHAVVTATGE